MQAIAEEYNFHVYHTVPVEGGYRIETNVGSKMISVWNNKEDLQWSFLWREELAKRGYRQIDRFIRTRDGAPFVKNKDEYIVVQDIFKGEQIKSNQSEKWAAVGQMMGTLFQAFKDVSHQAFPQTESLNRPFNDIEPKEEYFLNKSKVQGLKKELVLSPETMFSYLANVHWKAIERRWKQALDIYRVGRTQKKQKISYLSSIKPRQWILMEQGCLAYSTLEQSKSTDIECISSFLQELYLQYGESLEVTEYFYQQFEKVYQPSLEDQYFILSTFIYPRAFFHILTKYLHQSYSEEDCMEQWMEECEKQEKLNPLHLWFAERVDRFREETVSL
jgi:hypothetical protein